jgi:hypothetical protein
MFLGNRIQPNPSIDILFPDFLSMRYCIHFPRADTLYQIISFFNNFIRKDPGAVAGAGGAKEPEESASGASSGILSLTKLGVISWFCVFIMFLAPDACA